MKIQFLFLTFLSLCIPGKESIKYSLNGENVSIGDWKTIKNSEGVQTYVRWIENAEGIKTRERKGEMVVDCSPEDAISIITDAKSSEHWMRNVKESFDLKRENPFEWCTYTLFNIPWPFENRDLVSSYTMKTNTENNSTIIHILSKEDYIPNKSGITRLTNYTANWGIVRIEEKKVRITFTAITNTPPMFPRWIQDPILEHMFHSNLVNLKTYIIIHKKNNV